MKKLVSLLLVLALLLSIVPAALAEEPAGLAPMTQDEITLTYAAKGEEKEITEALAAQFEEKYPNIHVEIVEIDKDTYNDSLGNMASTQTLPDVFWVEYVTDAMVNGWSMDLNEFYKNDPDVKDMNPAYVKYSEIVGERHGFPTWVHPYIMVVNKTAFERYNVELPSYDWTWDDFVDIAEEISHPEDHMYGYGGNCYFEEILPVIQEGAGRFGWDGESWNFSTTWLEAMELNNEWTSASINATQLMNDPEALVAVCGEAVGNTIDRGFGAMFLTAITWGDQYFDGTAEARSGCEFLLYPTPKGESGYSPAEVGWGVICKTTQHPREAWELAKWMTWGNEATILRQHMEAEKPDELSKNVPAVTTPEVWEDLINVGSEKLKEFYAHMDKPFLLTDYVAPGYLMTAVGYYFGGIPGQVASGEKNPADLVDELNAMANGNRDAWLESWNAKKQ